MHEEIMDVLNFDLQNPVLQKSVESVCKPVVTVTKSSLCNFRYAKSDIL